MVVFSAARSAAVRPITELYFLNMSDVRVETDSDRDGIASVAYPNCHVRWSSASGSVPYG